MTFYLKFWIFLVKFYNNIYSIFIYLKKWTFEINCKYYFYRDFLPKQNSISARSLRESIVPHDLISSTVSCVTSRVHPRTRVCMTYIIHHSSPTLLSNRVGAPKKIIVKIKRIHFAPPTHFARCGLPSSKKNQS